MKNLHLNKKYLVSTIVALVLCVSLTAAASQSFTDDEKNTIDVVKQTVNSVVFITNIQYVRDFLFGSQKVARGSGSGFIWDTSGHIVTNYHVIEEGDIFAVTCPDQQTYQAKLVGKESQKDIAVLRITGRSSKFEPVKLGTSRNLLVGQKTIAIGNPFGFDHTVTSGIVSALGRAIEGYGGITIRDMIQTDASINPGNSGGPLLNSSGELIGMNTMIFSKTGTSSGIGFAVPVDTIKKIVPQIIRHGKVLRPGLGVEFLSDSYARRVDVEGAVIYRVPEGSAADRAGLSGLAMNRRGQVILGDVLVGIDDIRINSYDDYYNALDHYRIGEPVTLILSRNGKKRQVKFNLVEID